MKLQGCWYCSVIDGKRRSLLAGPFLTSQEARGTLPRVREVAEAADFRSVWYAFGIARLRQFSRRRPGRLNADLGLPTTIEDPWR